MATHASDGTTLDRHAIAARIPHAGTMCLLSQVTDWNEARIECTVGEPGESHPLMHAAALSAVAMIECAAQATAVHGALLDDRASPRPGMLVKLSNVDVHVEDVRGGEGGLTVWAEVQGRTESACSYAFQVSRAGEPVVSGQLMVAFEVIR